MTPTRVKLCCVCDACRKSFTVSSFHAGFSMGQNFYSSDNSETLFMPGMPTHLEGVVGPEEIAEIESRLPKPKVSEFKYLNPFRCPHSQTPYIDFKKFPEERNREYYGNTYLNGSLTSPPPAP